MTRIADPPCPSRTCSLPPIFQGIFSVDCADLKSTIPDPFFPFLYSSEAVRGSSPLEPVSSHAGGGTARAAIRYMDPPPARGRGARRSEVARSQSFCRGLGECQFI